MRIVFFGTPDFAVASLRALIESSATGPHEVVGVVTSTDKRGGRGGKQLLASAVKRYAEQEHLPVVQPRNLKAESFQRQLRAWRPDLQVVVAFRMLPRAVWELPPLGTVNVHGSLLPAYRGAAPIHWAVINGERETGISIFFLQHAIDTGDVLLQRRTPIGEEETTGDVYARLMTLGAAALVEAIGLIAAGQTEGEPQDPSRASHAPKLFRAHCLVDWSASAKTCHDLIRGLSPVPTAYTHVDEQEIKLLRSRVAEAASVLPPGSLLPVDTPEGGRSVGVACGDGGVVELTEVKPAGKRAMSGAAWRNGLRGLDGRVAT